MKKIYLLFSVLFFSTLLNSCSKDVLRSYDRRVIGTWKLFDIDRYGAGRSNNLPFKEGGIFSFAQDGKLTYQVDTTVYKGSWDIRLQGGTNDDEETVRSLHITVVDFVNQQILTEYFDEMTFLRTNRFNATIFDYSRNYVFRFQRQ